MVNETPGPGVDRVGNQVIDPTANVLSLVEAANRRQDDLREKDAAHLKEVMELRAEYDDKLRAAESSRIDAIRAVDQGNITRASEVAANQATALATQVQVSAEALRAQVEATRITTADALAAALLPIQNDVAVLREVQFRQQGEKTANVEQHGASQWIATFVVAALGLFTTIGVTVLYVVKK